MSSMRTLVVGPSWVGDMVMAQSLCRHLKQLDPEQQIDMFAPSWCLDIAQYMPEVNERIAAPFKHGQLALYHRYQVGKQLRAHQYDRAVILPTTWKSALAPFWANIPQRTGWLGELRYGLLNDHRPLDKKQYPLMVQRYVALAYDKTTPWDGTQLLPPKLVVEQTTVDTLMDRYALNTDRPTLALCPGAAFGDAKQWPMAYFAELAQDKLDQGWQIWLLGSPKEAGLLHQIQSLCQQNCTVLAKPTLAEKVPLLSQATAVVSNDSGLLHVAAALDRPVVAIYGSTTPEHTPPLSQNASIMQVDHLACRPCFKRSCPLKGEANLRCLKDITPMQVGEQIDALVKEPG